MLKLKRKTINIMIFESTIAIHHTVRYAHCIFRITDDIDHVTIIFKHSNLLKCLSNQKYKAQYSIRCFHISFTIFSMEFIKPHTTSQISTEYLSELN